jgi:hypothetical protein
VSDNSTNRLVDFSHYTPTVSGRRLFAVDPDEVAALQETQLDPHSIETQTLITLRSGSAWAVWETIAEVRRKLGR